MNRVVGIDIGIRNLGIAILEGNKNACNILNLELIDLCTHNTTEAIENLEIHLTRIKIEYLDNHNNVMVGIEQQPEHQHVGNRSKRDNTQMKSIAHATQMYFLAHKIPVKFISAKSKFNLYVGPPIELTTKSQNPYIQNKNKCMNECLAIMKQNLEQKWLEFVNKLSKKDDVCDAYLLAYYCITKLS